ncbi:hypothetical protein [Oceaniovalibus sp. ACAM 378]|uniref:hypothetical protein n=1 Tax=Oceaniovalibus sp. ACAM 378 TaxID=2599923 RepID=UPI0011D34D38|nr:hypothetical protein [Oceaniovalibus sp. ACAM 378]TYB89670.1 hypothetical protein FQ320_05945 [Oceaniovalibus sp. ACAM 378]
MTRHRRVDIPEFVVLAPWHRLRLIRLACWRMAARYYDRRFRATYARASSYEDFHRAARFKQQREKFFRRVKGAK